MLMHAALPGTQNLNDSKSASAPLWGRDTAPCSTSSHHSPWTLNVPHWSSEMTLAQNRGRGPQRAAAFWVLEILGNSCCGSRQTSAGVPCSPGAQASLEPRCHHASLGHCPAQGSPAKGRAPAPSGTEAALGLPSRALAQCGPAGALGSRRGRGTGAKPAALQSSQPLLLALGTQGKKPRRLFLRKPHYSIMFMGSKSTTHYLQHEI